MAASKVSLGKWLGAAVVVVGGIALLEQYDQRVAWGAAILLLLAMFLRYPAALTQIQKMLGTLPGGGAGGNVQ